MAHNLEIVNGTASFLATENAWHGLGTIQDEISAQDARDIAPWEVEKQPLFDYSKILEHVKNGTLTEAELANCYASDTYGIYRTDNSVKLGTVGNRYSTIQNEIGFAIHDAFNHAQNMAYSTVGVLGQGQTVFACTEIGEFQIGASDPIKQYLTTVINHSGESLVRAFISTVRVVCQNTLSFADRNNRTTGGVRLNIRHTPNAESRINEALKLSKSAMAESASIAEAFQHMANAYLNPDSVPTLLDRIFAVTEKNRAENNVSTRQQNVFNQILDNYQNHEISETANTKYALLNAITKYTSHQKVVRSGERDEQIVRHEQVIDGTSADLNAKALKAILDFETYQQKELVTVENSLRIQ